MRTRVEHHPPPITDPLGRHWKQPDRERVLVDAEHAVMSEGDFRGLHVYDHTVPTGTYTGKMWRCRNMLCWYGDVDGNDILIESRPVLLLGGDDERRVRVSRQ